MTCSNPPIIASARSRSKARCSSTRRWQRRRWSRHPTRNAWSCQRPSSHWLPGMCRIAARRSTFSRERASGWRRTSGCGGWSFVNCLKRSRGRSGVRNCVNKKRRAGIAASAAWRNSGRRIFPSWRATRRRPAEAERGMYELNERVGLVTGGGAGIGREIARRFAREGMAVAVLDRDGAEGIAAEIGGLAVTADVTSEEEVSRAVETVLARFSRIDVLVNNAGIAWMGPALEMPLEALQSMLRVNVEGVFIVCRAVLPHMIARRSGSIVNLASWAGKTGNAFFAGYSASKFAVIGLTQSLAREMAPHGIRVNAICPGIVVDTAMRTAIEAQQRQYRPPETAEREKSIPIGRVSVPEDVARVAAFLASDESSYMTGESINLSGGLLMD